MQTTNRLETLIENGYQIDMGAAVKEGWEIFKQNSGGFVGYLFVLFFILLFSLITVVGPFIIAMPLMVGFYFMADKIHKGERYSFGDFFGGFSHTLQLFLVYAIMMVISLVIMSPVLTMYVMGVKEIIEQVQHTGNPFNPQDSEIFVNKVKTISNTSTLLMIPSVYVSVSLSLAPFLVAFENLPAVEAVKMSWKIVQKQWGLVFAVQIVAGLIGQLGILALGVGVFVSLPVSFCIYYALYRQILPPHDALDAKIEEIGEAY